jgi:hypothetical protein
MPRLTRVLAFLAVQGYGSTRSPAERRGGTFELAKAAPAPANCRATRGGKIGVTAARNTA